MATPKYWYIYRYPHIVYNYEKDGSVWLECIGFHEYSNRPIGEVSRTNFNEAGNDRIEQHAHPYNISLLIKQYERYGIRKELLKDILIDIAANIGQLEVGSR